MLKEKSVGERLRDIASGVIQMVLEEAEKRCEGMLKNGQASYLISQH